LWQLHVFQSIQLCDFLKSQILWIGAFENSRIRLATHSECGDFCNFIEQKIQAIGYLINNAAQTVRRPAGFYTHLMENEERSIASLPQQAQELLLDHTNCLDELKC
jgi:hypothetical protein